MLAGFLFDPQGWSWCHIVGARVLRDGFWALAWPCGGCRLLIRNRGVKKVYYIIGPNEYGVWNPYE